MESVFLGAELETQSEGDKACGCGCVSNLLEDKLLADACNMEFSIYFLSEKWCEVSAVVFELNVYIYLFIYLVTCSLIYLLVYKVISKYTLLSISLTFYLFININPS